MVEESVVERAEYEAVDHPDVEGHWFCHKCHLHFGRPVYLKGDDTTTFLCPRCYEPEIEKN